MDSELFKLSMNTAYVYIHKRLSTGLPFYIGKGTGKRLFNKQQRSKHWHNVINKDGGFAAEKIVENVDDEFAFLAEIEAIDKYRKLGFKLINRTNGGEGQAGNSVNLGIKKTETHKQKLREANLGKKQSKETIEKRIKSIKEKENNGWINPLKREKNKKFGKKNCNFAGYYVTPNGKFNSIASAAKENNCSEKAVRVRCCGNVCKVNGKIYYYQPKEGWSFIPKV
jgi:hypothetical protein